VGLGAQAKARDGRLPGPAQRLPQQAEGAGGARLRPRVVGLLEVHGVHVGEVHEVADLDQVRGGAFGHGAQFVLLEEDHAAGPDFQAAHRVGPVDRFVLGLAHHLVADRAGIFPVHQVERHVVAPGGRKQAHGDVDQAEADRSAPEASHVAECFSVYPWRQLGELD